MRSAAHPRGGESIPFPVTTSSLTTSEQSDAASNTSAWRRIDALPSDEFVTRQGASEAMRSAEDGTLDPRLLVGKRGSDMGRLDGRVAILTGAGRGIGAATAAKLAAEGAAVTVTDMDVGPAQETAETIRSAGGKALAIAVDVTQKEQVEAAAAKAAQEFGRLDILVACAGITRDNLLFRMSDEDWDGVINTHLKGSFNAARATQKYMVEQKYGKMIFISSTSALGNRGQANYSTVKAGLQGLTRTLAIELGQI